VTERVAQDGAAPVRAVGGRPVQPRAGVDSLGSGGIDVGDLDMQSHRRTLPGIGCGDANLGIGIGQHHPGAA